MSMTEAVRQAKRIHILDEVKQEQERQVEKWGIRTQPDYSENDCYFDSVEIRDLAYTLKWRCNTNAKDDTISWTDIFTEEVFEALDEAANGNTQLLREELIQVAAVCASWIEDIDTRNK
jgi:hypothetical protein